MATIRSRDYVRVAFLTDSSFDRENTEKLDALKKRALRRIMMKCRRFAVEDPENPDYVFEIRRLSGSKGWCLHRRVYAV